MKRYMTNVEHYIALIVNSLVFLVVVLTASITLLIGDLFFAKEINVSSFFEFRALAAYFLMLVLWSIIRGNRSILPRALKYCSQSKVLPMDVHQSNKEIEDGI